MCPADDQHGGSFGFLSVSVYVAGCSMLIMGLQHCPLYATAAVDAVKRRCALYYFCVLLAATSNLIIMLPIKP
jgi:hypothetical protein